MKNALLYKDHEIIESYAFWKYGRYLNCLFKTPFTFDIVSWDSTRPIPKGATIDASSIMNKVISKSQKINKV